MKAFKCVLPNGWACYECVTGKTCSVDQKEDVVRDSIRTSNVYDRQKEASGRSRLDNAEAARPYLTTAEPNSDASLLENRTRGKVKEFIKMFDQETPQKFTFEGEKPGRKGVESSNAEAEPRTSGGTHIASKQTSPEPEKILFSDFSPQILWPGSGWKPVPLVDIVEGAAVRRAYQKAMLCLHPDKLQQKGGTIPQKYTAEKIFDILQDAWTNFNNVSSF
ncbi:J domain-containing protein required for chloroplast accumulation response 1 [Nymphaea thermarum]|nr:J domain-containing protein required for chloroplast accumulation response 1 [Nymphaea thermarum]